MGITERREREKIERRNTILNCAKELIFEQGVERVGMEDIARRAELSKATLYLYFSGKEILFNEICEESAKAFLERFRPYWESGLTGISALKRFWHGYVELFGDSKDMVLIFHVYNYLNSWPIINTIPGVEPEPFNSPYVDTIFNMMKTIIEQCKSEGVFDPDLDSTLAMRLVLSLFSFFVGNAANISAGSEKTEAIANEMRSAFQILIRGFAGEGVDRSQLDINKG